MPDPTKVTELEDGRAVKYIGISKRKYWVFEFEKIPGSFHEFNEGGVCIANISSVRVKLKFPWEPKVGDRVSPIYNTTGTVGTIVYIGLVGAGMDCLVVWDIGINTGVVNYSSHVFCELSQV